MIRPFRLRPVLNAAVFIVFVLLAISVLSQEAAPPSAPSPIRNIILMIPDGMATAHLTLGRWHRAAKTGSNRLALDDLACGLIRTYSSDAMVTDSAPSATAMATGYKTENKVIAVFPKKSIPPGVPTPPANRAGHPAPTLLEAAKSLGMATGLVVTSQFCHATPAAFSAHYPDRNRYDILSEQQVHQGIDLVLGGGANDLDPTKRLDRENLRQFLRDQGVTIVSDRAGMLSQASGPLWGIFAAKDMALEIDRDRERLPSMAEMTGKALEILSPNPRGFFLMIEGSQIDWAAHDNDAAALAAEVDAFDEAVAVALAFARARTDTVLIVAPDHSTGGMSISQELMLSYPTFQERLNRVGISADRAAKILPTLPDMNEITTFLAANMGINPLSLSEKKGIEENLYRPKTLVILLGQMASRRLGIGWNTTHHNGEDVPLFLHHPEGKGLRGVVQNYEIGLYLADLLQMDMARLGDRLFLPAQAAFAAVNATVSVEASDSANPVLVVRKNGKKIEFPVNKNLAIVNGKPVVLEGIVVCTDLPNPGKPGIDSWFVPAGALDLLK